MDALTTSLLVAVAVFLSSLVGLSLHRVVPEGHLSQETRSVILLGTGTLSLLASLVLGLLVSTAKSSYDATETRIQNYAAELILLDETLRDYGDSALDAKMPDGTITFWSSHARRSEYPLEVNRVRRARISGNRKTGVRRKLKLSIGEAGPASWSRLTNPGACSSDCDRPFRRKVITDSGIVITP